MDQVKYAIMHIDNSRSDKMSHIKNVMFFYDEVEDIEFINGSDPEQVKRMRKQYPNFKLVDVWLPKTGEAGVWYSQMQCWRWAAENNCHLLVFEDDAIPRPDRFEEYWHSLLEELPGDYDFFSLFVPNNQESDYFQRVAYDYNGVPSSVNQTHDEDSTHNFGANYVARVYQGYSCVATMYSPKGGRKLLQLADEYGMYTPVDCFLFLQAHKGNLDGYAPKPPPHAPRLVEIDWHAPTTIQTTNKIDKELIS